MPSRGQPKAAWRARKAAAFTRFWQVVEQNRRVPFREVSTYTRSHRGAVQMPQPVVQFAAEHDREAGGAAGRPAV